MDALSLVLADNDAAQGGTLFEEEDSVGIAALSLVCACARATVVARVGLGWGEGGASSDRDGLAQMAGGGWAREDIGRGAALNSTKPNQSCEQHVPWCAFFFRVETYGSANAIAPRVNATKILVYMAAVFPRGFRNLSFLGWCLDRCSQGLL